MGARKRPTDIEFKTNWRVAWLPGISQGDRDGLRLSTQRAEQRSDDERQVFLNRIAFLMRRFRRDMPTACAERS